MTAQTSNIAGKVLAALDDKRLIEPLTSADPAFGVEAAYLCATEVRRLRRDRGETPIGRKIGFTNRTIWPEYGVYGPIWGSVYDTTLHDVEPGSRIRISHLPQPRIEPEIVLGLDRDIDAGMSVEDLEWAIAWTAHGFEIVQCVYPDWKITAADCIADGSLHGMLLVGPRRMLLPGDQAGLAERLSGLTLELQRNGEAVDAGIGANALDGPIQALRFLAQTVEADPEKPVLRKGELVTTGTLTRAFPIEPGERWSTRIGGLDLPGLDITFV